MKKNKDNDLEKDDEILRIQAMEDGPKIVNGRTLRPITALTISWMQRNEVFSGTMDLVWKSAAFAYLHSEPYSAIRSVLHARSACIYSVYSWIENNMIHHLEISAMTDAMNAAFELYNASATESKAGSGSGN
jgi:hypothetical protein